MQCSSLSGRRGGSGDSKRGGKNTRREWCLGSQRKKVVQGRKASTGSDADSGSSKTEMELTYISQGGCHCDFARAVEWGGGEASRPRGLRRVEERDGRR